MNEKLLPRLLKAEEVAEATGLSLPRVYELVRAGVLPAVRLGRSVRFHPDVLQNFLEGGARAGGGRLR
jgi:excisionase family DNA binding protein